MFNCQNWHPDVKARWVAIAATLLVAGCTPAATTAPAAPKPTDAAKPAAPAATTAPAQAATTASPAAAAKPATGAVTGAGPAVELKMAAYTPTSLAVLPYQIAEKRGLWKAAGITITSTAFNDPPSTVNAIGKDFDFAAGLSTQVPLNAFVSGRKDLRAIAVTTNTSTIVFGVPKDSPIQKPADLKGKKIAIAVAGGVCHGFAADMVREAGLNPETDVEMIPGAPTGFVGLWTATKSGQFATTCLIPPISTQAVVKDGARIIYNSGEKTSAWAEGVLVTTSDAIQAKREPFTRLLAVWRESADWVAANPDEAGRLWAEVAGLEPDVATATIKALPKDAWSLKMSQAALSNVEKQMTQLGQLKQPADWGTYLDRSLLPADLRTAS